VQPADQYKTAGTFVPIRVLSTYILRTVSGNYWLGLGVERAADALTRLSQLHHLHRFGARTHTHIHRLCWNPVSKVFFSAYAGSIGIAKWIHVIRFVIFVSDCPSLVSSHTRIHSLITYVFSEVLLLLFIVTCTSLPSLKEVCAPSYSGLFFLGAFAELRKAT
jgi:hypothetical protein